MGRKNQGFTNTMEMSTKATSSTVYLVGRVNSPQATVNTQAISKTDNNMVMDNTNGPTGAHSEGTSIEVSVKDLGNILTARTQAYQKVYGRKEF